jgi:hypothetical protein
VRARRRDTRERYGLLLLALAAVFAVEGVATPGPWQQLAVSALLAATVVLALLVADVRVRIRRSVAILAAALVGLSLVEAIAGDTHSIALRLSNLLLVTLAPPALVVGTLRLLRARNAVTIEAVLSVLCLYLLIGMFFAFLYAVIGRVHGSFFAESAALTPANYQYFSFVTLTTVGYGDLTASTNLGHTLSTSEALVGQIYLVTVVSLIVSNLGRGRPTRPNSEQ